MATNPGPLPRLTPRVSQLRQEECADVNSREVNHEREIHTALQISQSWEGSHKYHFDQHYQDNYEFYSNLRFNFGH